MQHTNRHSRLTAGRQKLVTVLRAAGDVVGIDDVVDTLNVTRTQAATLLSRWARQGWLRRIRRGVYAPASIESLDSALVLDDPWVVIPALFSPCYVGGRTAAEYWDLTEQIFNDIVVFSASRVRERLQTHHGTTFTVKQISARSMFGTRVVWRKRTKVMVANVHKTVIDMLNCPELGGGIQNVNACLQRYLARDDRDDQLLIDYAEASENGAIFKRLGFLLERAANESALAAVCRERLTKGYAKLDPLLECPRVVTRWRIRIPNSWSKTTRD